MNKIGIVIVTYNRIEKLKKSLASYEEQSKKPDYILVVDNCSTDGTKEYVKNWKNRQDDILRYSISLSENMGGSGGYYEGLKMAENLDAEWIWVSDDDAYAAHDAIEILDWYIDQLQWKKISAICGSVWREGEIDTWHRRRMVKKGYAITEARVPKEEYKKKIFSISVFSYVGTALSKEALLLAGLPHKEYFIAYDDSEHSYRMRKQGKICCVPAIKVVHDTGADRILTWKTYYNIRNKISAYLEHMGRGQAILQSGYYLIRFAFQGKRKRQLVRRAIFDAWKNELGFNKNYSQEWKE